MIAYLYQNRSANFQIRTNGKHIATDFCNYSRDFAPGRKRRSWLELVFTLDSKMYNSNQNFNRTEELPR